MAIFDLSKINFLNRLNARARIFFLIAGIIGVIFLVYMATVYFTGGDETTGGSAVATAPVGLQSVPGGDLTPEYQRALEQANLQRTQQAQMTGTSALPTQIALRQETQAGGCIICFEDTVNVKDRLDDWVRQGKISPEVAASLQQLADKNVSVEDYAAELDRLVKEGKLTPEQARQLLDQYKKQHANKLLQDSAKVMDDLSKAGQLPVDVANQLLDAQKKNMSPAEYAAMLQEMVRQGKISPAVAQQLLAQYTQQRAKGIIEKSVASLRRMGREGKLTPDVEENLVNLEYQMVPVQTYASTLDQLLAQGKITPAVSTAILDEYKSQKAAIGAGPAISQMLKKAEDAAFAEINDLMKTGQMPPDVGAELVRLINQNIPLEQFTAVVNKFVAEKKITPEIGKLKIADYAAVKGLRDMQQELSDLQSNNASAAMYGEALKKYVQSGLITPEEANQLLQDYQTMSAQAPTQVTATTAAFADLQRRGQQIEPPPDVDFAAVQVQAIQETAEQRAARIQALITAMSAQATQLVNSWTPPTMVVKTGSLGPDGKTAEESAAEKKLLVEAGGPPSAIAGPPIIKAGTILFAVLDTAVNSDYPDSPVLATIVDGPLKGAKLLGKMVITKGVTGQMDRISLNFTMMNMDAWPKSKSVTAYAIDPDTARTVMASSVDYHYLQRFGAMMATSFLQGYATAITTSSSTSTTGIFGTSTTHPELNPRDKIAVALGQMGQTLGAATQHYVNRPPTVRVDSGVGLGILFMSDVTA